LGSSLSARPAGKICIYAIEDRIDMPAFNRFRSFEALDSCHQKIQFHLDELASLADRLNKSSLDSEDRQRAEQIELFFSTTARNHHAVEEDEVFPCLLLSKNTETVAKVRDLIEDHFWIEKYWMDLAPMLKALGEGAEDSDIARLSKTVKLFHDLSSYHIESEESMIYPQAKAQLNAMEARDAID
jgi:hemerythrin-like domain-containing protein